MMGPRSAGGQRCVIRVSQGRGMVTFEIVVEDSTAKCWYKLINLQTTLIERDCKGSFAAARICLGFS
jgi:hypothetical protein